MVIKKNLIFPETTEIEKLSKNAGITNAEATILYNRGITTVEQADKLLEMSERDMHNPLLMADAKKAAETILEYIDNHSKIVVYSDYDADGWGGAVVGYEMITRLGGDVAVYTNTREQGYGMCISGVDEILDKYPDVKLIVTADNGIVAFTGIDYAISKGLQVVVTDHHQPSEDGHLPNAIASVNPHRKDDTYPCKYLCGAAVLWKVLSICYYMKGISYKEANAELDVVALATVADVVPILDENRVIVKNGLKMITNEVRTQWKIFKDAFCGGYPIIEVETKTIGFSFGPCINAMSRMRGTIKIPINLFTMNVEEPDMIVLANEMEKVNSERKIVTRSCTDAAIAIVENFALYNRKVMVVYADEFYEGVVGLVAGRLRELYNRPTFALVRQLDGSYRGSGRSIKDFHMKKNLDIIAVKHPGLLLGFGGHALACGLTVAHGKIADFISAVEAEAESLPDENVENIRVDFCFNNLTKSGITLSLFNSIKNISPYGASFEEPVIVIKECIPKKIELMGNEKQHISIKFDNFSLISWNSAKYLKRNLDGTVDLAITSVNAVGNLEKDEYDLKLMVDATNLKLNY